MTGAELCGPSRLRRAKTTRSGECHPPQLTMHDACRTLTPARSVVHAAFKFLHLTCCDAVLTTLHRPSQKDQTVYSREIGLGTFQATIDLVLP